MFDERQRLETLKTIAETLNQCQHKEDMLQQVLKQLIQITHFESGWIFLEEEDIHLVADASLPTALSHDDKQPMCGEDCYCINSYKQGSLTEATNIMSCKRIKKEIEAGREDTNGITHHATVPLKTPTETFGLLNVAAPNRSTYVKEELDLIEAVALQMGTALKRIEQYEKEEMRVRLLEQLHTLSKRVRNAKNIEELSYITLEELRKLLPIEAISIHIQGFQLGDDEVEKHVQLYHHYELSDQKDMLNIRFRRRLKPMETDTLDLAIEYVDLSFRDLRLQDREKDMARFNERARLAQDLHDSVNQLLFSVVLTAKGAKTLTKEDSLTQQLDSIQTMSSDALKEMRTLIQRLKPHGLEEGVLSGLKQHADKIGLENNVSSKGTHRMPNAIEEALWRIGQEALHNAKKHAQCDRVSITLHKQQDHAILIIEDNGKGFDQEAYENYPSFGLKGMCERAETLGGECEIQSGIGKGTTIRVTIPFS
ncbi:GAF domain-containing sensor histidine kinase [Pontibacillus marinus]|uniref:histidine kinase n=1 Tax=Pontibacillus marinus BH030004 = DSM 16465 TaxID=1385511 RepID=A0A0A5G433_9BACI|nr:GAF domain-containing sensor histidine kinase [Pontibacillus marinus]KGX85893.1 hypothetical protein N783_12950 [Pontibacillus marinus BH030004 = DSM 16465]